MIEQAVADVLALRSVGGEALLNRIKQLQAVGGGKEPSLLLRRVVCAPCASSPRLLRGAGGTAPLAGAAPLAPVLPSRLAGPPCPSAAPRGAPHLPPNCRTLCRTKLKRRE